MAKEKKHEIRRPDWGYWSKRRKASLLQAVALSCNVCPDWLMNTLEQEPWNSVAKEAGNSISPRITISIDRIAEIDRWGALLPSRQAKANFEISLGAFGSWARTVWDGIGRGCSEYALTFYAPTKDTDGLFFQAFRKNAWSNYKAEPKKTRESNLNRDRFKNDELPAEMGEKQIKSEQAPVIKSVHQESESTNLTVKAAHSEQRKSRFAPDGYGAWLSPYISRLTSRGLAHACPVSIQ